MDVKNISFGSIVNPVYSQNVRKSKDNLTPFLKYLKKVGGKSFVHNVTISRDFIGVGSWHSRGDETIAIGGFTFKGKNALNSEALIKRAKIYYTKLFGTTPSKHIK